MARKLENGLEFFAAQEEMEFLSLAQPLEPDTLSQEWMRRDPRWTTDRLIKMGPLPAAETNPSPPEPRKREVV